MQNLPERRRDPPRFVFEPLGSHDRAAFSCGDDRLDGYLHQQATQDQRRKIATCFVLVDRSSQRIVGYYTLSAASIASQDLPDTITRRLPRYPTIPAVLLGRLAVDLAYQGQAFGQRLLADAVIRARGVTPQVAAFCMVVDAQHERVVPFYLKYGFLPFSGDPLRLFLPLATVRDLP